MDFRKFFNDDAEMLDDKTTEVDVIGNDKDFDGDAFTVDDNSFTDKTIVKIFQPVSKNITTTIMDSMKKGELCIINFDRINDEEAKIIVSTLQGSVYTMDGDIKRINNRILLCAPKNFIIDSTLNEDL